MKIAKFLLVLASIILAIVWYFNPRWNIEPLVIIILSLDTLAGILHFKTKQKSNSIDINGNSNQITQDVKTLEKISDTGKTNNITVDGNNNTLVQDAEIQNFSQKNTAANISNVCSVKIGDEIHNHPGETKLPKALSTKIPGTNRNNIVGREKDLPDLHTRLFDSKQVLLVNGLGGIGKTTLAQVYVDTYWEDYCHVLWVSQLSDDIANDFINTDGLLSNLHIEVQGKDVWALFIDVINELNRIDSTPNLLVIDNAVGKLGHVYGYLPKQPGWHILVTSRERIENFSIKELDFLTEDDAVQLFKKHYTLGKLNDSEIKQIVNSVDLHTLTIEILAKTAQTQRTEITHLMQAIKEDLEANVHVPHKGDKIERVTSYLCSIFNTGKLNENEIWLLKQFACLPPEFLPYELLEELIDPAVSNKEKIFPGTLATLQAAGWLMYNTEKDSYKTHRIISDVVKKQQPILVEDTAPLIAQISEQLSMDEAKDNPVDKFQWVPFGKAVLGAFPESDTPEIASLQNNLAIVIQDLGDFSGAKALLEKAVVSDEKNFGTDYPSTATSYSNLALVLKDLGDFSGAKALLEKTVASYEKNFGTEHPSTATTYSNLASILEDLGDFSGAKALLEKALALAEKNFGTEHPTTAIRSSNLASVLQALGDYPGAKALLEKALTSDEKNFGLNHPRTARSYSNLATVLRALGDYPAAKALLEKALASDEKNFGLNHPSTAIRYSNLATVLKDLGDFSGAKALLEKAVDSDKKNFGTEHPTTAISYSNLALVLQDLGDFSGAKALLEKAVDSAEKNFGKKHPSTARRYYNLSTVLLELGEYEQALVLSEKALSIRKKLLPAGHTNIENTIYYHNQIKEKLKSKKQR